MKIRVQMHGLKELQARLAHLKKQGTRTRILRKAINLASTPVAKDAKSRIHRNITGMLKLSIGKRVRVYPSGVVAAMVGPRTGYRRTGRGRASRRKGTALLEKFRAAGVAPTKYAHLVEFGTRPHALGKGSRHPANTPPGKKSLQHGRMHPGAKPYPFMLPAWVMGRARAERTIQRVVMQEIWRELHSVRAAK